MTDDQLDELMKRVNAGDSEAQAQIDAWIEEALGAVCVTTPVAREAEIVDPEELLDSVCCGSCSGAFAA